LPAARRGRRRGRRLAGQGRRGGRFRCARASGATSGAGLSGRQGERERKGKDTLREGAHLQVQMKQAPGGCFPALRCSVRLGRKTSGKKEGWGMTRVSTAFLTRGGAVVGAAAVLQLARVRQANGARRPAQLEREKRHKSEHLLRRRGRLYEYIPSRGELRRE
jgi:hypothetical protein